MSWLTFTLDVNSVNDIGDRAAAKVQAILADEYKQLRLDHANIINKLDATGRLMVGMAADITAMKSDIRGINSTLTTLVNQGNGDAHDLADLPAKVLQAVTDAFAASQADIRALADLTAKLKSIEPAGPPTAS